MDHTSTPHNPQNPFPRYARFSPDDGLLYVSVGAPCNVCPEDRSPQGIVYSTIYTINTTNGDLNLFARGQLFLPGSLQG